MGFDKPEDNRRLKIEPDVRLPNAYVAYSVPTVYRSFLDLKGCVLKAVDGNKLTLKKAGKTLETYLHGWMDYVYLTDWQERPDEKPCLFGKRNPLEYFVGRKITYVSRYRLPEDRDKELVVHVFLGVDSVKIPVDVLIYNDDGLIIDAAPSQRNISRIASKIMAKETGKWTQEDVKTMAYFHGVHSGETLKPINIFSPLTEELFRARHEDAYKKILEMREKQKEEQSSRSKT
jgi:hypothetical protein